MNNSLNNEDMVKNSNQPHQIKTPQTIEEFKTNLKKYYWSMGDEGLYVQQHSYGIKYDELNSLQDLYGIVNSKENPYGVTPWICPKVELKKDIEEYMKETNQYLSCKGLFENEEHFVLIDNQFEQKNPKWVGIDNQIWREFFYLTLGKFSGYELMDTNTFDDKDEVKSDKE